MANKRRLAEEGVMEVPVEDEVEELPTPPRHEGRGEAGYREPAHREPERREPGHREPERREYARRPKREYESEGEVDLQRRQSIEELTGNRIQKKE